jgi:hypothetical protein
MRIFLVSPTLVGMLLVGSAASAADQKSAPVKKQRGVEDRLQQLEDRE